jgi:hypothetical protein
MIRYAERRTLFCTTALLAIVMSLPDPDHTSRERSISMSKNAAADEAKASRETITPPARDPKIAVQEEYEIARQRGTAQALELFISRHPDDPLAARARADLRSLSR